MDLNKSDNKIRATKVYNKKKETMLDNEGLQYSCHGDEQSLPSLVISLTPPVNAGIKIDMGREQRAI